MVCKNVCVGIMLLVCTQSTCSVSSAYYQPSLWQAMQSSTSFKAGLCITAAVVIGFGVYKCWSWLSDKWRLETDRDLVERSRTLCGQINLQYDTVLRFLEPRIQGNQIDDELAQAVSRLICPIDAIGSCNEIIDRYVNQLQEKIAVLNRHDNHLAARHAKSQIAADIQGERNQLQTISRRLQTVHGFLVHTKPAIVIQSLWIRHEGEVTGVQQAGDIQVQWNVIKSAVMKYQLHHKNERPYLTYVGDLSDGLDVVLPCRGFLSQAANQACQVLENIRSSILTSAEYEADRIALLQDLARQQELEVQRKQAAAAAEQARAAQMRAAAQQQRARADIENAYERRRDRQRHVGFNFLDFIHDFAHPIYQ